MPLLAVPKPEEEEEISFFSSSQQAGSWELLLTSLIGTIKKCGAILIRGRGQRVHDGRIRNEAAIIQQRGHGYVVSYFVGRRPAIVVVLGGLGV